MRRAIYPGSFDPITLGHMDVALRAAHLFDEVVIAVGVNSTKQYMFDLESRLRHIRSLFEGDARVSVVTYSGLTVDFCKQHNCTNILRGLRDAKDFHYEHPIALLNRDMADVETVFVLPDPSLMAINSTIIREIFKNGGKIDAYVTNMHQLVK